MKYIILLLLLALCIGCSTTVAQTPYDFEYVNREPIPSLPLYENIYNEVLQCIDGEYHTYRPFNTILWFQADTIRTPNSPVLPIGTYEHPNEITLLTSLIKDPPLIKHEILHYYLHPISHGEEPFLKCDPYKTFPPR